MDVAVPGEDLRRVGRAAVCRRRPELAVRIEGPAVWLANRDHEVSVTVANPGTAAARMVDVRTALPAGWALVGGDEAFAAADSLAAGGRLRMRLVVRPTTPGEGVLRAEAEAAGLRADAELTAAVRIDPADSEAILERFVREVGFEPAAAAVPGEALLPRPAARRGNTRTSCSALAGHGIRPARSRRSARSAGRRPSPRSRAARTGWPGWPTSAATWCRWSICGRSSTSRRRGRGRTAGCSWSRPPAGA